MAARKKQPAPSLDEDRGAIRGLWLLTPGLPYLPVVMVIDGERVSLHDFGSDSGGPGYALSYQLEERGGERVLVDALGDGVSLRYHLDGDGLDLVKTPDRRDERWDVLEDRWRRVAAW